MDIFEFRNRLVGDYSAYISSFIRIREERVQRFVQESLDSGALWPDPLIQLNPFFEPGNSIDQLVQEGVLHPQCSQIFRREKSSANPQGEPLLLHRHQSDAIRVARGGHNYLLTTGSMVWT